MSGSGFDKLFPIPKSPRDAHRAYARSRGGLHVHARIADVEHPLLRRARQRENLLHHGRIRLQRHPFALAEDRGERNVGKKQPDELLGSRLKFVRRHGDTHAAPHKPRDQLRNPVVRLGVGVDMLGIVFHEIGAHGRYGIGRTKLFGQRALHEPHDAVADEMAVLLVGVLRKAAQGQNGVAGDGQIADRIEQRAVEVEDDQIGIYSRFHNHCLRPAEDAAFLIFQPRAATHSDISGLTILKIQ